MTDNRTDHVQALRRSNAAGPHSPARPRASEYTFWKEFYRDDEPEPEHEFRLERDYVDVMRRWACSCGEYGGTTDRPAEWVRRAWERHVDRETSRPEGVTE